MQLEHITVSSYQYLDSVALYTTFPLEYSYDFAHLCFSDATVGHGKTTNESIRITSAQLSHNDVHSKIQI